MDGITINFVGAILYFLNIKNACRVSDAEEKIIYSWCLRRTYNVLTMEATTSPC